MGDFGWDVHVLTTPANNKSPKMQIGPSGEVIETVAAPEGTFAGPRRILSVADFAVSSYKAAQKLKFDLVVSDPPPTSGYCGLVLAHRRSVPFVYYMADSWAGASRGAGGLAGTVHPFLRVLENRVLRRSDSVVAATAGMGKIAEAAGSSSVHVVPNGVPVSEFLPGGAAWSPTKYQRPFFIYAGNAGLVHGAHVFMDAAINLWDNGYDFDLVYMGYGRGMEAAEAIRRNRGDRLHLFPPQPQIRVAEAFRGATGALSSLRPLDKYADARPVKTMSGLAAGCPAVYVGSGDFASLLKKEGLGFVHEYGVAGAEEAMLAALRLHFEGDPHVSDFRIRCAEYAATHFDDRVAARAAAEVARAAGV